MKRKLITYFLFFIAQIAIAQKEDYNWIMGTGLTEPDSNYKLNFINFLNDSFEVDLLYHSNSFFGTESIISDPAGNLLCYTNGINIYNRSHAIMQNGQNFQSSNQYPYGYPFNQVAIILPFPDSMGFYLMIDGTHKDITIDFVTEKLRYSTIDINGGNGLGEITEKKITIPNSSDTLNIGHLSAIKHGNGRDWWLLVTKFNSNIFRRFLFSPDGIQSIGEQKIGETVPNSVGYSVYSPNGEWYAHYNAYGQTSNPKASVHFYRFDRCAGLLSDPHYKFYPGTEVYGGVAFSPNSRFLYVSKYTKVFQYDLESPDILASEKVVAEYDGFLDENGVPTRFYGLQLAPDNKIYGNIPGFNSRYLHVIDQPNLPGDSCNVVQHAIYLPAHNFGTLPNLPFYRLYEEEGSPCDTLATTTQWVAPVVIPDIRVWPVPAADVLYFSAQGDWSEPLDLVLYDALGRLALSLDALQVAPYAQIDLSMLPPGAYFFALRRQDGTRVKTGKVVRTK